MGRIKQRPKAYNLRSSRKSPSVSAHAETRKECSFCSKIERFLVQTAVPIFHREATNKEPYYTPTYATEELGIVRNILKEKCSRHLDLLKESFENIHPYRHENLRIRIGYDLNIYLSPYGIHSIPLHLSLQSRGNDSVGTGRIINSQWIDHGLFREWKQRCDRLHGDACVGYSTDSVFSSVRPSWLVDVWRQCIVPAAATDSYVALSYVWGTTPSFSAEKSNITLLQSPFSLQTEIVPNIAKTIRDAMGLTKILGERYLWVDQLYIIQDDETAKHTELANMAAIFANASITIIAAQGHNVNCGLRGLCGVCPRSFNQKAYTFGDGIGLLHRTRPWCLPGSVWESRGWTYQEYVCSQRMIIFDQDTVMWECCNAQWIEDYYGPAWMDWERVNYSQLRPLLSSSFPNINTFVQVVSQYNRGDLTYPEDALFAFSGIMSVFASLFKGDFISGLPTAWFHIALTWQRHKPLSRRAAKNQNSGKVILPSWSWAGWHGHLNGCMWAPAADFVRKHPDPYAYAWTTERVIPLVEWSYHNSLDEPGTPIQLSWYNNRQQYGNSNIALPHGWKRHSIPESQYKDVPPRFTLDPGIIPHCFYTHSSTPGIEYWYPLPLLDAAQPMEPVVFAPFISCQSRRAWLFGSAYVDSQPCISILDSRGEWAGVLIPDEDIPIIKKDEKKNHILYNKPLEFAEISCGSISLDVEGTLEQLEQMVIHERCFKELLRGERKYEYYHVLWIEWTDGVAYRKGLGRIRKSIWEAQAREEFCLMLG